MTLYAVIKTGGKQYLVKEGTELYVDNLNLEKNKDFHLETLAIFDEEAKSFDLGKPLLDKKVEAKVLDNLKADKIRVAKFKAKVRYRRVRGYRHQLSKIKITKI